MAWKASLLVVANVTADSDELLSELLGRAARGPLRATLLVHATGGGPEGRKAATERLQAALERWRAEGLEEVDGIIGDADPIAAVHEAWDPKRYDEVIVSTLSQHASRWLQADLPHRVERITGVQVSHVVSQPKTEPAHSPAPVHERARLGPLSVLGWGRSARRQQGRRS